MPRNFLIAYNARVGSTALIDTLKLIPGFVVPVFEELDFYSIESRGLLAEHNHETIHRLVDYQFSHHAGDGLSIGFKWRVWGDNQEVAKVLAKHRVCVFNMMRADLIEYTSSVYLSDVANADFNAPQFLLQDTSDDVEREKILFRYRMNRVTANEESFLGVMDNLVVAEVQRLQALERLRDYGCEIVTILYEEFAYTRYRFLNKLLSKLCQPKLEYLPTTKIAKVSNAIPSELFTNRQDIYESHRLRDALPVWDALLSKFGSL